MRKALALLILLASTAAFAKPPRLVLFISVDGMGSELFLRSRPKLKHGFLHLQRTGAFFPSARYTFTKTSTGPGHTTLATGANPWRHGVVGNRGMNRKTGKLQPILADPAHPALEAPPAVEDVSPENLRAETLADRLRLSTWGRGKVVSLSHKARAAIPMAGRLGQAYWFHDAVGKFVSGTFYTKEFPQWLRELNARKPADAYFGREWQLSLPAAEYLGDDDRATETDILGLGRTFPHALSGGLPGPGPQFYDALGRSPYMNEVLLQAAAAALAGEQLGKDEVPDLLAVSFSSIDKISHLYGPYSWEVQDAMLRLDRTLMELIAAAEKAAGKGNLLVVLAADHGSGALPEEWAANGLPAGRLNPETLGRELNAALKAKFGFEPLLGIDEDGVDVYLDPKLIADRKADGAAIRRAAAQWLSAHPQIALAVARDDLETAPDRSGLLEGVRRGFHEAVSGDVLFVARPFQIVDRWPSGTNHASPWSYDAVVPVFFAGRGVKPGTYGQQIDPTDVAPTLAHLLEMVPPAQAEGVVRAELLGKNGQ